MENNKITIHQAFYGEVNRSHTKINQTFNDADLTSFLIAFTDRPAALPPGVTLSPYLSGSAFSNYYVFTKTFSDPTATRAGMVFTHALIIDFDSLDKINNLQDIFGFFVNSVEQKNDKLEKLEFYYSEVKINLYKNFQPKYIQQLASASIKGVKPILFSGSLQNFRNALQHVWNSLNLSFRKKLKFRTSFTPSDITNRTDLIIVLIQKEFLPKWQGQSVICDEEDKIVEITSLAEALFLGYKENNPFHDFLNEINVAIEDIQDYTSHEKIFNDYCSIDSINDENAVRQNIRLLSKMSPSPTSGEKIKEKFIERFSAITENNKDSNIKALKNIDWSAFSNGENKAKQIVSQFIIQEFKNSLQPRIQLLSELIDLSVDDVSQNWWHSSIRESVILGLKRQNKSTLENIWQSIDSSTKTLKNIIFIVENVSTSGEILRRFIPNELKRDTCETLLPLVKKQKWYLLHADILLMQGSPSFALERQLDVENKLSSEKSLGVIYISKKLTSMELILLTLKLCTKKLVSLLVDIITKDSSLLKNLDLSQPCWFEIWASVVEKTGKVFNGLTGREQKITYSVLDSIIEGKILESPLLILISETTFSDISKYPQRKNIWTFLPKTVCKSFLDSTKTSVLNDLLLDRIEVETIESEIIDEITSDNFMANFLSENRADIEPVIKVYTGFSNLRDDYLADYISYYRYAITDEQSKNLGSLIVENNYLKSARSVYDKSRYDRSFSSAYETCSDLVNINWLESLLGPVSARRGHYEPLPQYMSIEDLPTVVILTAIKEEYLAVRSHLSDVVDADRNDTTYEAGIFQVNERKIAKVFIRECGAKNTNAAQESERAIQNFNPSLMLFVGIAGSRKPNDFAIGDVIFPEKVYSYEGGKSEKDSFQARPDFALMSYTLMETAKKVRLKNEWKTLVRGDWTEDINANLGVIASGEELVEHYESDIGRILTKHYNDTSAVEMEGFGFAKAANRQGRNSNNILIGVVRGISDVIEQTSKKKKSNNKDQRPDYAKKLASDTASAFAFWLIFKTYEKK